MPSERVQRQIERLLDEADEAASRKEWAVVLDRADHALTFDPGNQDALALRVAAWPQLVHPSQTRAPAAHHHNHRLRTSSRTSGP